MTDNTTPAPMRPPRRPGQRDVDRAEEAVSVGEEGDGVAEAHVQVSELAARYARLAADFDNFRKRTAREQGERSRYAAEAAAAALLPVLDNLRRAVDAAPVDTAAGLLDGLHHTVRQFDEALASVGVTPIEALGARFDPALHEAVIGEESDAVEVDTVVMDLQRGYRIGDRVLRPTMVKVAHPRHGHAAQGSSPATGWVDARPGGAAHRAESARDGVAGDGHDLAGLDGDGFIDS